MPLRKFLWTVQGAWRLGHEDKFQRLRFGGLEMTADGFTQAKPGESGLSGEARHMTF
jgi:hypothetical protein